VGRFFDLYPAMMSDAVGYPWYSAQYKMIVVPVLVFWICLYTGLAAKWE
jgi:hypothetical protein